MYTCIPSLLDFLSIQAITEQWVEIPGLCIRFSLVIHFIHSVYMSVSTSQFVPPSHWFPQVCSLCLSLSLLCEQVHLYHSSRFHIYALVYDICFALPDFLHSVGQSLGLSMSLQTAVFCSFLWLSDIPYEQSTDHQHEGPYCHVTDE